MQGAANVLGLQEILWLRKNAEYDGVVDLKSICNERTLLLVRK